MGVDKTAIPANAGAPYVFAEAVSIAGGNFTPTDGWCIGLILTNSTASDITGALVVAMVQGGSMTLQVTIPANDFVEIEGFMIRQVTASGTTVVPSAFYAVK